MLVFPEINLTDYIPSRKRQQRTGKRKWKISKKWKIENKVSNRPKGSNLYPIKIITSKQRRRNKAVEVESV